MLDPQSRKRKQPEDFEEKKLWKERGREHGSKWKKGKFTSAEDEILRKALLEALRARDMDETALSELIEGHDKSRKFTGIWEEVASKLEGRSVVSCYEHVRARFADDVIEGEWDIEDVEKLKFLVEKHGRNWKLISQKLGRLRVSCRDKYREICNPNFKKGPWSKEEEQKFKELLLRFKDIKTPDGNPPWTLISTALGTRSDHQVSFRRELTNC
jgi:hypothetical protein